MKNKLKKLEIDFEENVDLAKFTTMKVGCKAKFFLHIKNEEQLKKLILLKKKFVVLGKGSKTLFKKAKVVAKLCGEFEKFEFCGTKLVAGAAAGVCLLAGEAEKKGLAGMEFLMGIPASVGGAIIMNAGAFGGEMSHIVKSVVTMDKNGEIKTFKNKACKFGYRHSIFKNSNLTVLQVCFKLTKSTKEEVRKKTQNFISKRRALQPQGLSFGSAFKKPQGETLSAGELIDKCGLKGAKYGCAKISEKHANFILNEGNAKVSDCLHLIKKCKKNVYKKFKIKLKEEIIIIK